jgi:hypothetical protein
MSTLKQTQKHSFRVIDAMDAPHSGRVVRLRLQGGHPPALKELKGATLRARSPEGEEENLKVIGFFIPGGKPSDSRFSRTGRIDLVVDLDDGSNRPSVSTLWEVSGPL